MLHLVLLIVWDEAGMQHRFALEAVSRSLQDIRDDSRPFGGIMVAFGGDFQQTLPLIVHGSREEVVEASLLHSLLWPEVTVLPLTQNMRVGEEENGFALWLLDVGHERNMVNNHTVSVPQDMVVHDVDDLINFIYSADELKHIPSSEYFKSRAILSPRNTDVDRLNEDVLSRMDGTEKVYVSADCVTFEDGERNEANSHYTIEYLPSVNVSSLPPSRLILKRGCPIIILRNSAPSHGLCNGTRATACHSGL